MEHNKLLQPRRRLVEALKPDKVVFLKRHNGGCYQMSSSYLEGLLSGISRRSTATKHRVICAHFYANAQHWHEVISFPAETFGACVLLSCYHHVWNLTVCIFPSLAYVHVFFLFCFGASLRSSRFGSPEHKSFRSTRWHKFIKRSQIRSDHVGQKF